MTPAPRLRAWTQAVAALTALGLAPYVGLFLDTVRRGFVRAPFGDSFDILDVEFAAQDRGDPGVYLWHPHNGHHIVWLRLLTSLDARLFHFQSTIFVAAALLALVVTAALLAREIWRGVEDRRLAAPLAAIAPLALLTSLNAFDVAVPINTPYVLALVFAVGACVLVETGAGGLATLFGLLLLTAAAGMGNSVGLAVAPVVMIAILRRKTRGGLPLYWLAAPILVAVFVLSAGAMSVETAAPAATPLERGLRGLRYFVSFCGLPWSASSQRMAVGGGLQAIAQAAAPLLGLVLVGVGAGLAATPAKGDARPDRLDRICCNLILFSLAAAAMAALGRANASPQMQLPVRYAVILAPLHIGVLVLLATRHGARLRVGEGALLGLVAVLLAAALVHQVVGRQVIVRYADTLNRVLADFAAGRRTPEMTEYVYPKLAHAEAITAQMQRRGLPPGPAGR